jgi:hypothetical protein
MTRKFRSSIIPFFLGISCALASRLEFPEFAFEFIPTNEPGNKCIVRRVCSRWGPVLCTSIGTNNQLYGLDITDQCSRPLFTDFY